MKINSIIVDDEKHGRENLKSILAEYCPGVNVMCEADSVDSAIPLIQKQKPQLVFLDIEMPAANGFQLFEHFVEINFEVIFVTAYGNYAIKAIRFSAADYILKPINYNDLKQAVERVARRVMQKAENDRLKELHRNIQQPENPRIGLPIGDRIEYVELSHIIHCKGEGNYTHIYLKPKKHLLVAKTLVEFEDLLGDYGFIRTHKSHLVNLVHVKALLKNDGGVLLLSNGHEIAISRRRKEQVVRMLKSNF
jgi:two-component system LytT family response regulator